MLANRADYWPALHPIPKEVPVSDRALPTMPTGRLVEFVVQPQGERLLSVRRGDLRREDRKERDAPKAAICPGWIESAGVGDLKISVRGLLDAKEEMEH